MLSILKMAFLSDLIAALNTFSNKTHTVMKDLKDCKDERETGPVVML